MESTSKPNMEQEPFLQTILYLEGHAENGRELFRQFREGRVLLSGEGESFRTLVHALLRMGLRAPVIVEPDDKELTRLLQEAKERDSEMELKRVAFGRAARWLRAQTEPPALVVHVSDKYRESEVNGLTEACAERGVPALIGTQLLDSEWGAALIEGMAETGWYGLLHAFEPPAKLAEDSSNARLLIGNVAALEVFRVLTGLKSLL